MTHASYKWPSKWPGDRGRRWRLSRRAFLGGWLAAAASAQRPEVSAFDLSLLEDWVTPTELFFVREHFPAPSVSSAGWKLSVSGVDFPYDELLSLPRKTLPATIECAENPVGGGLVSHAEWTGVSLALLLEKVQTGSASYVRLSGADGFARSIPLTKAMHPDTLIAYNMNGARLPENHGFPLRAVIPGWYGMDSIKWLRRVEFLDGEDANQGYVRQIRSLLAGTRPAGPVTAMRIKSAFSRPVDGAILVGRQFPVRGAAWAGENRVRQVEISTDGGKQWQPARLGGEPQPYAWVHWSYEWKIPRPGQYELAVRAADEQGRSQPPEREPDRLDDYERNAWQIIQVTVT